MTYTQLTLCQIQPYTLVNVSLTHPRACLWQWQSWTVWPLSSFRFTIKRYQRGPCCPNSLHDTTTPPSPSLLLQSSPQCAVPLMFSVFVVVCSHREAPWGQGVFRSPLCLPHLHQCLKCNRCSVNFHWTNEFFTSCPLLYDSLARKAHE